MVAESRGGRGGAGRIGRGRRVASGLDSRGLERGRGAGPGSHLDEEAIQRRAAAAEAAGGRLLPRGATTATTTTAPARLLPALSLLGAGGETMCEPSSSTSESSGFRNPFKKCDATTFDACKDRGTDSPFKPYSFDLIKKFVEQPESLVKPAGIDRDQGAEPKAPPSPTVPMMPEREFVDTLNLLSHKISFLQNLIPMIYQERGAKETSPHLQMVAASGLATVVSHLSTISANLLPYLTAQAPASHSSQISSLSSIRSPGPFGTGFTAFHPPSQEDKPGESPPLTSQDQDPKDELQSLDLLGSVHKDNLADEDEDMETEKLDPGTYELVEMDAVEILAEHTHFCEICGKGFKRDANLRMHMRGHGDEYKTPAALARPDKPSHGGASAPAKIRRYSCPYLGCKRNKCHKKFVPLKTMLCVKNHYRRSHCPKVLTCSKCRTKKFSVVADLKTHEKHCGKDKWMCSCGTTFSRKDKLIGHLSLFTGHVSATPLGCIPDGLLCEIESSRMDASEEVKSFHDRPSFPSLASMPSSHEVRFRNLIRNNSSNAHSGHKLKMEDDFLSDVSLSLGSVHSQRTQEGRLQNFFS